jgi:hypothetical protein
MASRNPSYAESAARLSIALVFAFAAACSVFVREVPVDHAPPTGVERSCVRECARRVPICSESRCARGCNLVLDRLAEREGPRVVACMAARHGECDDWAWSRCAAWIGDHADGGPPPPAPPSDDVEE